eukprot:7672662-Prorocentrum_lima.AAC.1
MLRVEVRPSQNRHARDNGAISEFLVRYHTIGVGRNPTAWTPSPKHPPTQLGWQAAGRPPRWARREDA